MIKLSNNDIATIIYEEIKHCSGDYEIRNKILDPFEHDEELHEKITNVYDKIAEEYFVQGYLMAKQ